MDQPNVIVICSPTASGKTDLSIELAKKIQGEIVSADSMQIYTGMDIGTAKVTQEEKQGICHYMIDIVQPNERFSVAQYKTEAQKAIETILKKGKRPIVVGGTGLYINSLIYNICYPSFELDSRYREQLEKKVENEGLEKLYEQASKIDPQAIEKISRQDKKRILRVLELYHQTGKTKTELEIESRKIKPPYYYQVYGIKWEREILYERINQRVDNMIQQGLIEEVQSILNKYQGFPTAMQGLGYKEVVSYLQGNFTKEEMIEQIKKQTRHYAKRQMTWFRAIEQMIWLPGQNGTKKNVQTILEGQNIG